MKILLTGATGFIGRNLAERLISQRNEVFAVIRPSTTTDNLKRSKIKYFIFENDISSLNQFIVENKITGIVHLASLFLSSHKPSEVKSLIDSNVTFPSMVLESTIGSKVKWFINTGTFWQHFENKKYSPVNLYAATKQSFEDIARFYWETTDLNFVTLKLSDTFGPGDLRKKVFNIWSEIGKTGEAIEMSPGRQLIDINYIDNVIDAYIKLVKLVSNDSKRRLKGKVFAVRAENRISLKKMAKIYEEATGEKLNINWGGRPYRAREVMDPWKKGITVPGWKPIISLRKGIAITNVKKQK